MGASNGNKTGTQRNLTAKSLLFMKYLHCKTRHEAGNFLSLMVLGKQNHTTGEATNKHTTDLLTGWEAERARLKISEGKNYEKRRQSY